MHFTAAREKKQEFFAALPRVRSQKTNRKDH
jgi:hypothetical protein